MIENYIRNPHAAWALACSLALGVVCGGCSADPDGLRTITGDVTWGGEPLSKGSITFTPVEPGRATGGKIVDGQFEIAAARGAKPGSYLVSIEAYLPTGKKVPSPEVPGEMVDDIRQMIPPKYNSSTELRAEIEPGGENHFSFQLDKQ